MSALKNGIVFVLLLSLSSGLIALINIDAYSTTGVRTILNIPSYTHNSNSQQGDEVVHPDVLYIPGGWHGYTYWMSFTPYPNSNSFYENPSIVASNDNINWVVPTYPDNPLSTVEWTASSNNTPYNSDPDLLLSAQGDTLFCVWRRLENWTLETIYYKSTTDGVHWTSPESVLFAQSSMNATALISPSIIYYNGKYRMWNVKCPYIHSGYDPEGTPRKVQYREASTLTGLGSASIQETNIAPISYDGPNSFMQTWHINVIFYNGYYWMINQVGPNNPLGGEIYLCYSSDGINWTFGTNPLLYRRPYDWDKILYRASIVPMNDGTMNFKVWYSSLRTNGVPSRIGYTETIGGEILPVATEPTAISYNGFTAHWKPVIGATEYNLDVFQADGITYVDGYHDLKVEDVKVRVDFLNSNTTYKYCVRAYNANEGFNSNVIQVTTKPVTHGEGANTSMHGEPTTLFIPSVIGGPQFSDNNVKVDPDNTRDSDFSIIINWCNNGYDTMANARIMSTVSCSESSSLNGVYTFYHKRMGFVPTFIRYKYNNDLWKSADFTTSEDSTTVTIRGLAESNNGKLIIVFNDGLGTFPVVLTSYTAMITPQNLTKLTWTTQCETGMQKYCIKRNTVMDYESSKQLSPTVIVSNNPVETQYIFTDCDSLTSGMYYYWLTSIDINGYTYQYNPVSIVISDGRPCINRVLPTYTNMLQVYPNPFNPITNITINVSKQNNVKLEVYNLKGERICNIIDKKLDIGSYNVIWNGKDDNGHNLNSGIYLLKMVAANYVKVQKLILMK